MDVSIKMRKKNVVMFSMELTRQELLNYFSTDSPSMFAVDQHIQELCKYAMSELKITALSKPQISFGEQKHNQGLCADARVICVPDVTLDQFGAEKTDRRNPGNFQMEVTPEVEDAVFQRVVEVCDFEIPQELIDNEVEIILLEQDQQHKMQALQTGDMSFMFEDRNERLKQIRIDARNRVIMDQTIKSIIRTAGISVTREERIKEAEEIAKRENMTLEQVKGFLGEELSMLETDLLNRKAILAIWNRMK